MVFRPAIAERVLISSLIQGTGGVFISLVTKGAHWSRQLIIADVRMFTWMSTSSGNRILLRLGVSVSKVLHSASLLYAPRWQSVFITVLRLGLVMLTITLMRSWSAMTLGITSLWITVSYMLVTIMSKSVVDCGVTRVGFSTIWCSLFVLKMAFSLLPLGNKLSFKSPSYSPIQSLVSQAHIL